jgi:hypothetical protein
MKTKETRNKGVIMGIIIDIIVEKEKEKNHDYTYQGHEKRLTQLVETRFTVNMVIIPAQVVKQQPEEREY